MCDCGGYSIGEDDQTIEKHQSEMSHGLVIALK